MWDRRLCGNEQLFRFSKMTTPCYNALALNSDDILDNANNLAFRIEPVLRFVACSAGVNRQQKCHYDGLK